MYKTCQQPGGSLAGCLPQTAQANSGTPRASPAPPLMQQGSRRRIQPLYGSRQRGGHLALSPLAVSARIAGGLGGRACVILPSACACCGKAVHSRHSEADIAVWNMSQQHGVRGLAYQRSAGWHASTSYHLSNMPGSQGCVTGYLANAKPGRSYDYLLAHSTHHTGPRGTPSAATTRASAASVRSLQRRSSRAAAPRAAASAAWNPRLCAASRACRSAAAASAAAARCSAAAACAPSAAASAAASRARCSAARAQV